jgi:hypothetical protein
MKRPPSCYPRPRNVSLLQFPHVGAPKEIERYLKLGDSMKTQTIKFWTLSFLTMAINTCVVGIADAGPTRETMVTLHEAYLKKTYGEDSIISCDEYASTYYRSDNYKFRTKLNAALRYCTVTANGHGTLEGYFCFTHTKSDNPWGLSGSKFCAASWIKGATENIRTIDQGDLLAWVQSCPTSTARKSKWADVSCGERTAD